MSNPDNLPELTAEEQAALDSLGPDWMENLLRDIPDLTCTYKEPLPQILHEAARKLLPLAWQLEHLQTPARQSEARDELADLCCVFMNKLRLEANEYAFHTDHGDEP